MLALASVTLILPVAGPASSSVAAPGLPTPQPERVSTSPVLPGRGAPDPTPGAALRSTARGGTGLNATAVSSTVAGLPTHGASATSWGPANERTMWFWPTGVHSPVLAPFSGPDQRWQAGHLGVDLRSAPGAPVRSPAHGTVSFVGSVAGRPLVSVDHPGDLRSTLEPVTATVSVGDTVAGGQVIGTLVDDPRDPKQAGGAWHTPGTLHWGVRRDTGASGSARWEYLDPMSLLSPVVVRLLPL